MEKRRFRDKLKNTKLFWISLLIIIQTVIYTFAGINKTYYHMDEMYSYGLTNYDRVNIYDNEDFYNQWHDAAYYKDYLVINEDERGNFAPVYTNQRDDVHPPLYYLMLRLGMEVIPGEFSKWPGIILNIIVMSVNTIFLYLVVEKLLGKSSNRELKTFIITTVAALSIAVVSTTMYIRMYAMLTMFVTITLWLHLKLLEQKSLRPGLCVAIGVTAFLGVLTQYYYIFFLLPLFIMFAIKYIKAERMRDLWIYTGTLAVAAVVSLVVWPYSIQHMFFGYRGVGVLGNLLNFLHLGEQLGTFAGILAYYGFSFILPVLLAIMFILAIRGLKLGQKLKIKPELEENYRFVLWPALVYFLIAATASPYTDLRYISPICGLMIVVVLIGLAWLVRMATSERVMSRIMLSLCVVMLILPLPLQIEPNVEYSRLKDLTVFVEAKKSSPAIYLYNPGNERFLDDLFVFTEVNESYIMHHQECTESNFKRILSGKDLSDGLIVFANYGDTNELYLKILREATGLSDQTYIARTNSADVYYLKR